MFQQKEAIVKLLSDDDPGTVNLVKEQLVSTGEESLDDLQALLGDGNENVRRHVTDILGKIDAKQAAYELSILCPLLQEEGSIEDASWLLARALIPGTDVKRYRHILDHYGEELGVLLEDAEQPKERISIISGYLALKHGFRGNSDHYYEAGNSLMPCVIDSRRGIPISLTLLYMMVGERAGMKIEGINLPGHFLAKYDGIIFDPFETGRIVTLADCNEILARQNLTFDPSHVEVATPRMMLRRLLTNLLYIFQNNGDAAQAERLAEWVNGLDRS
ncbi:MAG: transglutaminase family protein [Chthoniobacteraceae bacterium]